jgi:hypothetical protein
MACSIFKDVRSSRIARDLKKTYYLAIILVLIPVIFINLGTTLSAVNADSNDYLINYYSHNSSVLDVNRYSPSTLLDSVKYKRVTLSALTLLPVSKDTLNLKTRKEFAGPTVSNDISIDNFKYVYKLLDLPPPSYSI